MKNLEWIKTEYFAHRGLHNKVYPENTFGAFNNAVKHEFDIELDIRLSKDQQIVVFHDNNLQRLCGRDMNVSELNYEQLKTYLILKSNEKIPLLKQVLDTLPKETKYLIELKPVSKPKLFVSYFIELMKDYEITYAIHSFDPRIINEFRKQDDSIIRGQIASTFKEDSIFARLFVKNLHSNKITKPDFTNYRFEDLPSKKLDKLHKKGHVIISYVARNEKNLKFVRSRYDNAVFENFIPVKQKS
jgi:glycerophosphoryl diester phosphodiesterase